MTPVRGALTPELDALARDVLLRGPGALPQGLVVLAARPERWVVLDPVRHVVVKAFVRDRGWRAVARALTGSRAARSFDATVRARALGVSMAEPLAALEVAAGSVLVSAEILGAKGLRAAYQGAPTLVARRALAVAVARLLAHTHAVGIYPSDFNDTNVVVDDAGRPVLVDAEGLRFVARVSARRRTRNLERLLRGFLGPNRVTRATRLRFLAVYAGDRRAGRAWWGPIARRFADKQAAYGLRPP